MYRHFIKRIVDILISITVLIVVSPILLITMIFLFIANQGKIFFIQQRPGYKGNPFYIIKFKTMNDKKDKNGDLLPDHIRLTQFGKFVRKTSIDELPQLINVLKGDLSLVGPRPLLMEYLPLYNNEQARRHEVRPGITGWAQVNGRNGISWEKKFELDVFYVDHLSLFLDIKIIFLTLIKVFKSEGISSASYATMEKFSGTKLTNN